MSKSAFDLFEFEKEINIRPEDISEFNLQMLIQHKFLNKIIRKTTICLESGCNNRANIQKINEQYYVIDEIRGHCQKATEDDYIRYEINYEKLILELLSNLFDNPEDFTIKKEKEFITASNKDIVVIILYGKYTEAKIENFTKFSIENLEEEFLFFIKDGNLKRHIKELSSMIGINIIGINNLEKPSRSQKKDTNEKIKFFKKFKKIEEKSLRKEPHINKELALRITKNPNYLVTEFLSAYRTKDWEHFEELTRISFGFLINFDISSFGGKEKGEPVPDGFGFSVDSENRPNKVFIVDSKSLGTEIRDTVSINFYESEKYLKYLRDVKELEKMSGIKKEILIFIAPKFNIEQIKKISENMKKHADFENYKICFMELLSLVFLLKLKNHYLIKRDLDLNTTMFREFLSLVFNNEEYIKLAKEFNDEIEKLGYLNSYIIKLDDIMEVVERKLDLGRDRRKIFEEFRDISLSS